MRGEIPGLNPGTAFHTGDLEFERGEWNSECRGEIRRYSEDTSGEGGSLARY